MLRRRQATGWFLLAMMFILPLALSGESPHPRPPEPLRPLAELAIGASRIDWQPAGDTGRLVLTVGGPEGLWFRKEFEAGQPASLSLFDDNEQRLPDGAYTYELRAASGLVQSGHFSIKGGSFVTASPKPPLHKVTANLTDDELIIQGNACIGEECTTSDDDFPVLRLKGQNPNILFDDVEGPPSLLSSSFNDWAIRINPSDVAKFSIFDVDGSLTPFSILGGAPDNSLFISDNGDVGIGTATPAERLHVVEDANANTLLTVENPNTGTNALGGIRAKSDSAIVNFQAHGSGRTLSRFGQTLASWAEFLQVTGNGFILGTLADKPLILGTNSTNRVHIAGSGNVGIGTTSPTAPLHVSRSDGTAKIQVTETSGTGASRTLLNLENNGQVKIRMKDTAQTPEWLVTASNAFQVDNLGHVGVELQVNPDGALIVNGTTMSVPDYVFEPGYRLMPLDELKEFVSREKHLPNVPSAEDVKKDGLNLGQVQMQLLQKVEELTLYTLRQDEQVKALLRENARLNARLQALELAAAAEPQ